MQNLSGLPDKELLGLLAAAENGSEHYLARALREFAQTFAVTVDSEKVAENSKNSVLVIHRHDNPTASWLRLQLKHYQKN